VQVIAWRTVSEMTYDVSSATLNLTHSLTLLAALDQVDWLEPQIHLSWQLCCLHPPSLLIITHPGSWYPFYHSMDGRKLSRPAGWLHIRTVYLPSDSHPSSTVTSLTKHNMLPLCHATNHDYLPVSTTICSFCHLRNFVDQ